MLQVDCYEIARYEVKIANKPIRAFYTEEKALKFIEENINDYVFMRRIEHAVIGR